MWKKHPIYTNYELNKEGQIRNVKTRKLLKGNDSNNHKGYVRVTIHHEGIQLTRNLHRLVMETFSGLNDSMEVNHRNGDKLGNNYTNLEWSTRKENAEHAAVNRLYNSCEDVHTAVMSNDLVKRICESFSDGNSIIHTMKLLDIPNTDNNFSNLSKIKNRKTWKNISCEYQWSDDIKFKTYSKDMLIDIIDDILDGVKLKKIASRYTEYDNKKLYNTIKKINSGKLYKDLVREITDKRSTTIEIEFIFSRVE